MNKILFCFFIFIYFTMSSHANSSYERKIKTISSRIVPYIVNPESKEMFVTDKDGNDGKIILNPEYEFYFKKNPLFVSAILTPAESEFLQELNEKYKTPFIKNIQLWGK